MGKKMKLPLLFKNRQPPYPWQWPLCSHPKTLSFRAADDMFKTINSVFFDPSLSGRLHTPPPELPRLSTQPEEEEQAASSSSSLEMIIREAQSERLFFEPDETRSIVKGEKGSRVPFEESVMLAMESEDPYEDFRRSMEEMVETHGLKDWDCLEELLGWYLRVNGKMNHGFIVGAFLDLLVAMAAASSSSDSTTFSSAVSSFSSPSSPLSPSGQKEIDEKDSMKMIMS